MSLPELDGLRSDLEAGLAALEAALANPDQSGSLESLILDLSRVATKEAEAAARRACITKTLEAESYIANVRAATETALKAEVAASMEARRNLEAAEHRLSALEAQRQAEVLDVTERFEGQLAEVRATAATLERALAQSQQALETERASRADLQQQVTDAQTRESIFESNIRRHLEARQQLTEELARERAATTDLRQALDEVQRRLEADRLSRADLERQVSDAQTLVAASKSDMDLGLEAQHQLAGELAQERATTADLRHALGDAQHRLEADRLSRAELERQVADAQSQAATFKTDLDRALEAQQQLAGELAREHAATADLRHALDDAQLRLEADRLSRAGLERQAADAQTQMATTEGDVHRALEAQQQLAGELAQERATTTDLRLALDDAQRRLEADRLSRVDMERQVADAQTQLAAFQTDMNRGLETQQQLTGKMATERAVAADLRHALDDAQRRLEAERLSRAELERQMADAQAQMAGLKSDIDRGLDVQRQLAAEVAGERAAATDLRQALDDAEGRLRAERISSAGLLTEISDARARLSALKQAHTPADAGSVDPRQLAEQADPAPSFVEADRRETSRPAANVGFAASPAPVVNEEPQTRGTFSPSEDRKSPTRQNPRYTFRREIELKVDGEPCRLVDLSVRGCQILSQSILRPNRVVRVEFPSGTTPIICNGKSLWARLEQSSGQHLYRAGVLFAESDQAKIHEFLLSHVVSHVGGFR